jgi:hypothetical protein
MAQQTFPCREYSKRQSKETEGQPEQRPKIKKTALGNGASEGSVRRAAARHGARKNYIFHFCRWICGRAFFRSRDAAAMVRRLPAEPRVLCFKKPKMQTDPLVRGATCGGQAF